MANTFDNLDINILEPHILYWAKNVTSVNPIFVGQEVPESENIISFQFLGEPYLNQIPFRKYADDGLTYTIYFKIKLRLGVTVYGENCSKYLQQLKASIWTDEWMEYFENIDIDIEDFENISMNTDYEYTDYKKQIKADIIINTIIKNTYNTTYIDTVNGEIIRTDGDSIIETVDFESQLH